MKKIYIAPRLEILAVVNAEQLCDGGGLTGWSSYNESDGNPEGGGNSEEGEDPDFGEAGAKHFNCWDDWND